MTYTALYRKFRPSSFGDMIGQDHVIKTLKNQIESGRVGHAYLFSGGRGTGKTSAAKIFARAINCTNINGGEPCNTCEICKGILSGYVTDVVEMDAASNNSVEDIRNIREEVNFLPTIAKYRIYIIDEVHMLSTGAFNALLKTLEEPPAHVKFILATTEPQKIPATILSRCQRFDFKRHSDKNIKKQLKIICENIKIEYEENALNIIAALSEGAMRDGISILERCIQDGDVKITEDKVKDLVGIPNIVFINQVATGIINNDIELNIKAIDEVVSDGKDINIFLWEVIKYIKDILVYKTSKNLKLYNTSELEKIEKLAGKASKERLVNIIYELSDLENLMKWSSQQLLLFQTGIIKCSNPINTENIEELRNKISELESKIDNGIFSDKLSNNVENTAKLKQEDKAIKVEIKQEASPKTIVKSTNGKPTEYWQDVLNLLKKNGKVMIYTNLLGTTANIEEDFLDIGFNKGLTSFGKTVLEKVENKTELEKIIKQISGKDLKVRYIDQKKTEIKKDMSIEGLIKDFDIPINIIEE